MRIRALSLAAALVLTGSPAFAVTGPTTVATDPCGDGGDLAHDLARVDLHYSATSFQVRVETCESNDAYDVSTGMVVDIHLVSLDARIRGVMNETGRNPDWTGFELCTTACVPIKYTPWDLMSSTGYGSWAAVLPGVPIPDSIEWYATLDAEQGDDRAPDAGSATSNVMPVARASHVTIMPIPGQRYSTYGNLFLAYGDSRYDSATGPRFAHREITVRRPDGSWIAPQSMEYCHPPAPCPAWRTSFRTSRNTTVHASFDGDGFTAASNRPSTKVLISALVSLDLPATKDVRRGTYVFFRGVVRPKGVVGQKVIIQVRNGGAGAPWRTYATPALEDWGADTFYSSHWRPTVTGTATFRVVWPHGTTSDGGVTNGISNYTTIRVV